MEDLPFGIIVALVPQFAVKDLPLGRTHDDDDDQNNLFIVKSILKTSTEKNYFKT